jgi:hypothetical protein
MHKSILQIHELQMGFWGGFSGAGTIDTKSIVIVIIIYFITISLLGL